MAAVNKNKFIDLKKMIKEEPGTNLRLQSLKVPRDLNLGLPKQPKKVFVPNLNVVRNKEKSREFNRKHENKDRVWEKRQRNKDNSSRFVQSSGVFSEGIGNDIVRTKGWTGSRGDKENDNAPVISMPTIKKNSFQVDKKNEDSVLSKITDCDEDSDGETPPFKPISWKNRLEKVREPTIVKSEINSDIKIKEEIPGDYDVTPNLKKLKLEPGSHNGINVTSSEFLDQEKLNSNNPSVSLWGLPDSFAAKGLSDDPNCNKIFDYGLGDMHEGQIGKIVIRKSGRMEIHIGLMKYELEPGELESYKEDIVSLDTTANKNKTNAATLGNIQNRYFLAPDWDRLLL